MKKLLFIILCSGLAAFSMPTSSVYAQKPVKKHQVKKKTKAKEHRQNKKAKSQEHRQNKKEKAKEHREGHNGGSQDDSEASEN